MYVTEANPQIKDDKVPGWEPRNSPWITECVNYVQSWNAMVGTQPVTGLVFYRWQHDWWTLDNKPVILNQIKIEAKKWELGVEVGDWKLERNPCEVYGCDLAGFLDPYAPPINLSQTIASRR